jgi:hypothetical protein
MIIDRYARALAQQALDTANATSAGATPKVSALATASSSNEGLTVLLQTAGQPDALFTCEKLSNGTYDWVEN